MSQYTNSESGESEKPDWRMSSGARILRFSESGSVPEGAVRLQKSDVCLILNPIINNWKPAKEVWSLKHGPWLLAIMSGISGAAFTAHIRVRMLLGSRARFASYVPSVVIPLFTTTMAQQSLVYKRLLNTKPECLLCSNISAISVQLATGIVQPYLLALFASSAVAKLTMVYPLPPLTDIAGVYRAVRLLSHRLRSTALVCVTASVINTTLASHAQAKAVAKVHQRLKETSIFVS